MASSSVENNQFIRSLYDVGVSNFKQDSWGCHVASMAVASTMLGKPITARQMEQQAARIGGPHIRQSHTEQVLRRNYGADVAMFRRGFKQTEICPRNDRRTVALVQQNPHLTRAEWLEDIAQHNGKRRADALGKLYDEGAFNAHRQHTLDYLTKYGRQWSTEWVDKPSFNHIARHIGKLPVIAYLKRGAATTHAVTLLGIEKQDNAVLYFDTDTKYYGVYGIQPQELNQKIEKESGFTVISR